MNELKNKMITKAMEKYSNIFPCASKTELVECFTTEGNMMIFWFNTSDESTHVMTATLKRF